MALALSYITGILSLLFAASFLNQYLARREPQHLLWFGAFALFTMAMGMWFLRETFGLNQWILRLWFFSGAILVPAFLGTGILYLVAPRRVMTPVAIGLVVVAVVALIMALATNIKTPSDCLAGLKGIERLSPSHTLTQSDFFPAWLRIIGALLNLVGGVAVLAGAGWAIAALVRREPGRVPAQASQAEAVGAWNKVKGRFQNGYRDTILGAKLLWRSRVFWRGDLEVQRAFSTLIIVLGLAVAGIGLTMNSVEGSSSHLGLFLIGALITFGGFLASREIFQTLPHNELVQSIQTIKAEGVSVLPVPEALGPQLKSLGTRLGGIRPKMPPLPSRGAQPDSAPVVTTGPVTTPVDAEPETPPADTRPIDTPAEDAEPVDTQPEDTSPSDAGSDEAEDNRPVDSAADDADPEGFGALRPENGTQDDLETEDGGQTDSASDDNAPEDAEPEEAESDDARPQS